MLGNMLNDLAKAIRRWTEKKNRRSSRATSEIVGSLAWLARVCRSNLSFGVCHLQSCVHDATYAEIKFANSLVALAKMFGVSSCFMLAFWFQDVEGEYKGVHSPY